MLCADDLVMVAVLNTFATVHETNRAGAVGIFWSYFCLIWWLWVSQMVYDIRFSAEDIYHRLFKLLQIFVFVRRFRGQSTTIRADEGRVRRSTLARRAEGGHRPRS